MIEDLIAKWRKTAEWHKRMVVDTNYPGKETLRHEYTASAYSTCIRELEAVLEAKNSNQ